jgi:hypothetical protein
LRQPDLGFVGLADVDGLLLAVSTVVEVPIGAALPRISSWSTLLLFLLLDLLEKDAE